MMTRKWRAGCKPEEVEQFGLADSPLKARCSDMLDQWQTYGISSTRPNQHLRSKSRTMKMHREKPMQKRSKIPIVTVISMLRMLYRVDHRVLPLSSHGQPPQLFTVKIPSVKRIEKAAVQIERPYFAWQREGSAGLAGNFPGEGEENRADRD